MLFSVANWLWAITYEYQLTTDCRTFQPCRPSSAAYKTVLYAAAYMAKTSCNQLIDAATYVIVHNQFIYTYCLSCKAPINLLVSRLVKAAIHSLLSCSEEGKKIKPGWFRSFSSKAIFISGFSVREWSFNSAFLMFSFSFSRHSGPTITELDLFCR